MKKHGLEDQAVEIVAMELTTDQPQMFNNNRELVGYSMSKSAAEKSTCICNEVYKKTGVSPKEIGVVELHDCFSANELVTYEAIQLCD